MPAFLGCLIFSFNAPFALWGRFLVVFGVKRPSSKILIRERGMGCLLEKLAPEAGLEPATRWLTASCSTIELLWKLKVEGNFNWVRGRRQACFAGFLAWLAVWAEKGASRGLNDSLNFFRAANAVFSFSSIHAPQFFGGFCPLFSSKVEEAVGVFFRKVQRPGSAAFNSLGQGWFGCNGGAAELAEVLVGRKAFADGCPLQTTLRRRRCFQVRQRRSAPKAGCESAGGSVGVFVERLSIRSVSTRVRGLNGLDKPHPKSFGQKFAGLRKRSIRGQVSGRRRRVWARRRVWVADTFARSFPSGQSAGFERILPKGRREEIWRGGGRFGSGVLPNGGSIRRCRVDERIVFDERGLVRCAGRGSFFANAAPILRLRAVPARLLEKRVQFSILFQSQFALPQTMFLFSKFFQKAQIIPSPLRRRQKNKHRHRNSHPNHQAIHARLQTSQP